LPFALIIKEQPVTNPFELGSLPRTRRIFSGKRQVFGLLFMDMAMRLARYELRDHEVIHVNNGERSMSHHARAIHRNSRVSLELQWMSLLTGRP
jgi:hypothetical protein